MKYKICDGCGANIDASSRACVSCGKRQRYGMKTHDAPAKLMECPTCGNAVSENARTCPQCGEEFETGSSFGKKFLIFLLILIPLSVVGSLLPEPPEPVFAKDGSHTLLVEFTKLFLNDPDSFQHIRTEEFRGGIITMRYRARNSFGGMVVNKISARYDPETGALIEVPLEE